MNDISVINGVQISCDEESGKIHFAPIEQTKSNEDNTENNESSNRSWIQKVADWYNSLSLKLYVKKRNLSDPFNDNNYEGGTRSAIEAGVKIEF